MKVHQIYQTLDKISPFELQDDWDNSGLVVGDLEAEIDKIYLSLDADIDVISQMDRNSLLVVHHPPIFKGLKSLKYSSFPASLLVVAIKKDISIVAMHTNFDKTHLNRYVLENILGYKTTKVEGYLAYFDVNEEFNLFAKNIANRLNIEYIKTIESHKYIKTAALCTGSGSELISELEADCLLTGDIKYHLAKDASSDKISLIDIGHYESEIFFASILQKELQNNDIFATIANSKNPFSYIKG